MKTFISLILSALLAITSAIPHISPHIVPLESPTIDITKSAHLVESFPAKVKAVTTPTAPNTTVNGFTYHSCQTDSRSSRVLTEKSVFSQNMTLTVCSQFCGKTQYFGLEYSSECYCGSTIANTSIVTTESDCWMPCSGDSTAICGGNDRISIFRSLNYTTPVIPNPPAVPGYAYRGCYADKVGSRTIDGSYFFDEEMTTTKCAGLCGNSTYFGTEYGGECYCSSTFPTLARGLDGVACGSACKGDGTQACGGFNALSVYWRMP